MTKDEALRLALEVMNLANSSYDKMLLSDPPQSAWRYHNVDMKLREAITAIEAVLEAKDEPWEKFCDSHCVWTDHHPDCKLAKDEPVAYLCENAVGHKYFRWKKPSSVYKPIALYTTPPQRTWVGLNDEEIAEVEDEYIVDYRIPAGSAWNFAKDIEAKLKEKNT
jgi:hypothetical protein